MSTKMGILILLLVSVRFRKVKIALLRRRVLVSSTYLLRSSEKRTAVTYNIKAMLCEFYDLKSLFVSAKEPGYILGSRLKHQGY